MVEEIVGEYYILQLDKHGGRVGIPIKYFGQRVKLISNRCIKCEDGLMWGLEEGMLEPDRKNPW